MKKTAFIVCAILLALLAVPLIPAQTVYADMLTDLGFSTSSQDLENYDQRKDEQPYNSKNVTINPVAEEFMVEIGPNMERSLTGDNELGGVNYLTEPIKSGDLPVNNNKYVKAAPVDLNDEGKPHAVAELYYREANNGELWLTIVNAGGEVERDSNNNIIDPAINLKSAATNEILVFSNRTGTGPLITDYKTQHILLNMVAGDFDNDGFSEIVVYIPETGNPHLALYQIVDGQLQADPEQTLSLDAFAYMAAGDITGDNLPDLVVSESGVSYSKIYIFKSQDFSFSKPHIWGDGKNYYEPEIYDTAVAIGKVSGWHDHPIGLVIAGYSNRAPNTGIRIKYQSLLYLADETTAAWKFVALENGRYFSQEFSPFYKNDTISITCAEFGATTESIYINGMSIEGGIGYLDKATESDPETVRYYDYDVIAGNFDGNAWGYEELRIIREKQTRVSSLSSEWQTAGLELVAVNAYGKSVTPLGSGTTCAALAAPNTDEDTVIVKYKGYDLQYSSPTILAVLASPPYFEDLEHLNGGDGYIGDSSTEISSGEGSGSETHGNVTVTAGAYASLESEVSIFGFKIAQAEYETEFSASYAWDVSHETEVATAISYGTFGGQDSVALYTIPMDVFKYEVWCPGAGGKGGYWTTMNQCFPYPAAYVVIPVDKYDEIASRETNLPRIGGELFKHTLGRPETYHKSSTEMYKVKDPVQLGQFSTVGYGDAYTAQSIEITETDTDAHTFSAEISHRVGAGAVGATAGITFSIGGGGGWATTTIKNVGYTGTLMNMPLEAESSGYNFAWKLVAYPYVSDTQSFPVVTYAVDQVRRPPLLPKNMEMTNATENSVTLTWDNVDPNVTGYQLFRYYDFEGDLAGYKKIGDVIPVGTTSFTDVGLQPYTSYRYKIQSIGAPYGGLVTNSVLGPECTARTAPAGAAPVITQQPVSVEVAAGSTALFQVTAQPAPGAALSDRIFYQWQRYMDGRWQVLGEEEDSLLAINGVGKEDAGRYRCAVSQYVLDTPITIYSNPVTLTVNKNNLDVVLDFNPSAGYGDRNKPVTITAELTDADPQITPTGKINFLFTFYSDPVIPLVEGVPQPPEYPNPVLSMQEMAVVNGNGAQIVWAPPGYGSYDIAAVYLGDNNYHQSASATSSFICSDGGSPAVSGLRITGIENNILTYGDVIDLGATVWQNGTLRTLIADEVNFVSSNPDGLSIEKSGGSNPQWQLSADQAGIYELKASATLGGKTLKASKNIVVEKAQIALKAVDQYLSQGNTPAPFTMQLTAGELKMGDSLDTAFNVQYRCIATADSPPGIYGIFIDSITQLTSNYEISEIEQGIVIIDGPAYNIKFRGVSNGTVTALINNWKVLEQNYAAGYDIAAGSAVRFSAIPASGYRVEKWIINGNEVKKGDGSYDTSAYITTSSLNQDVLVEVYFEPHQCQLTYSAGANGALTAKIGSLDVGSGATLPAQTVVSFQATPDEGYMVSQWIVNNSPLSDYSQNSYNQTVTQDTDVQVSFAPAEYVAISYTAEGQGQVSAQTEQGAEVANNGLVTKGSKVVFTATPHNANSMVKEWVVNGQVVQGGDPVYTAQNIQQALQVKAVFIDAITYTVTFGAMGHGAEALTAQVDGVAIVSGDQVIGYADVAFTAYPPAGWQVKQWKLGSSVILDAEGQPLQTETYTLEELKTSVTVTVEFESANTYRVNYEVAPDEEGFESGSLSARVTYAGSSSDYSSGDEIRPGSQVVLTAVPDSGYTIAEWTVDGSTADSTEPIYTIDSIQEDYEITVKFAAGTNPLTFAAIGSGTISAESADGAIASGEILEDGLEAYFTAEPDTGWQVKEWRYNGEKVEDGAGSYTLTVNNGGYVEVEFEREYYTLTLGENLSASVNGFDLQGDQVQGDSSVTVTASPPAGHLLTAWYRDGMLLSEEQGDFYSFTMEQDTEITADFTPQSYSVTFTAGENGTLSAAADENPITSGAEQPGGCSLIFTAQPAEDYRVSAWYRDLAEVSGQPVEDSRDEIYVIDALSKPEYIRVYFEQIPDEPLLVEYLVYFSAGSGGSISATADGQFISSGASVAAGSELVFTAAPDSGKTVLAWSGTSNGTLSANKLIFTISSLSGTENVQVIFKNTSGGGGGGGGLLPTPSGTLVSGGGGTIRANGVTLTFPAGAVEDDIRVRVREVSQSAGLSLPENSQLISKVVDIVKDASGNFSRPVTITLSFDTSQTDPEKFDIRICYYDEESCQWVPLDNIQVNLASGKVSGDVSHFTKFAVLAVPKTVQPATPAQPSLSIPADLTGHWAKDSVMKLMEAGIVSGYQDGSFRPDRTISRAEFTVMLVKALKLESGGEVFADTASHWAKDSIATAAAHGIINGYDENSFGPDDPVTREQAALIITRAARAESSDGAVSFTDSAQISPWAQSGVAAAVSGGFFTGYPDGSFRPQNNMTRAEAAVLIVKFL